MSGPVTVTVERGVLVVALAVPATRNALSFEVLDRLEDAFRDVDPDLVGAVLTGSGGLFSAGADFGSLTGTVADVGYDERVAAVVAAILDTPWPVVAAIDGACLGAAADLALACDFRVLSPSAFVEVPAARLGIVYNPAAVRRLHERYADDVVRRLLVLGERIDAPGALAAGIATRLVATGSALDGAVDMLAAAPARNAAAVAAMRRILNYPTAPTGPGSPIDDERRRLLATAERRQAIASRMKDSGAPSERSDRQGEGP